MKYRIKVMPYQGRLIYIPQRKVNWWSGWKDVFINGGWGYNEYVLNIIESEMASKHYLKDRIQQNLAEADIKKQKEEFTKANPVKYIDMGNWDE